MQRHRKYPTHSAISVNVESGISGQTCASLEKTGHSAAPQSCRGDLREHEGEHEPYALCHNGIARKIPLLHTASENHILNSLFYHVLESGVKLLKIAANLAVFAPDFRGAFSRKLGRPGGFC